MKKGTKIVLWIVGLLSTAAVAVGGAISISTYVKQRDCEHEYNEGEVQIEATCEDDGVMIYECEKCGKEKEETIAMLGHSIVRYEKTDATCTEDGLSSYTACERCGGEETGKTILPATGHHLKKFGASFVAATCTEDGKETDIICTNCDYEEMGDVIPATGHTLEDVAETPATCETDGLSAGQVCVNCDYTTQEVIPAGHTPVTVAGSAPTCTTKGLTAGKICSTCEEIIVEQKIIKAFGHNRVVLAGYAATCTEDGLTEGQDCTRCEDIAVEQEVIPATGHTLEDVAETPATCETDGLSAGQICVNCDYTTQELIPAGHTIEDVAETPATCEMDGLSAGQICENCDYTTQELIPATGHTSTGIFGEGCTVCSAAVYITNGYALSEVTSGESAVGNWYRVYTTYYEPAAESYQPRSFGFTIGSFPLFVMNGELVADDSYWSSVSNCFTNFVGWDEEGDYIDILVEEVVTYKFTIGSEEYTYSIGEGATLKTASTDSVYRITAKPCTSDHVPAIIKGKEATCTESGLTDGSICLGCGEVLVARQTIAEVAHAGEVGDTCTGCGEKIQLTNYTLSEVTVGESAAGNWDRIYANPDDLFEEIRFADADGSNTFVVWGNNNVLFADDPETMWGENSSVMKYYKSQDEKGSYYDLYIAEGLSFTVLEDWVEEGKINRDVEVTDALTVTAASEYVYRIDHEHALSWVIESERDVMEDL